LAVYFIVSMMNGHTNIEFPKLLREYDFHWLVHLGWILTAPTFFTWWLCPVT